MSDFGAFLTIKKNDRIFSASDKAIIDRALENLEASKEYVSLLAEPFAFEANYPDGIYENAVFVVLSEYWNGNENEVEDQESFEFAMDHDLDLARKAAEKLGAELGDKFVVEANFDAW